MELVVMQNTAELERLEGIITRNLQSFYEVGRALMEIRDRGYYRDVLGFDTFEAYCKSKWDFQRTYAYHLIAAVQVVDDLSSLDDTSKPTNQLQTRPLEKLTTEKRCEAWQRAVETAPEGKVTAAHVYKIVKGMTEQESEAKEKAATRKGGEKEEIDPEFKKAWDQLFVAIKNLKALHWRGMTRDAALKQIQVLLDVIEI